MAPREGPATPINPERIARLEQLGLNEQQARAYLALLDVPTATVNDLSKTSRVPRAKLYEVLESLNRKGLVDVIPETPQRFRANPVSALYDTRVEELRAEEADLKRSVADLMVALAQGQKAAAADDTDFVHVLHGRTHFATLLRRFIAETRTSIHVIGDKLFLPRLRILEDLADGLARTANKASVRILLPAHAVEEIEGRRIRLDEVAPLLRRAPWPLGDAAVVVRDQEEYFVVRFLPNDLHPSRGSDRVEVGREPHVAALWHQLVEDVWQRAPAWQAGRR
jgi:HTH-type transcriptional regulator, sugar sensing transcriptional regulator